jgi:hypothetical protein
MKQPIPWKLPPDASDWQAGWESSRRFQVRLWASLPFERKLAALEEMNDYAREAELRYARRMARGKDRCPT